MSKSAKKSVPAAESALPSNDEMKKIVKHYGDSEKTGAYDSLDVGIGVTLGEVRKALKTK